MSFKKSCLILCSFIVFFSSLITGTALAERTVRVGWYSFGTLSTYHPEADTRSSSTLDDLPGVYGGYNYEYLRMISQLNGWKLQFVYGTINECLERLENGSVDLVGGVGKIPIREEKFAFPVNSALRTSIALIARADDFRFTMNDFDSLHGLRVGAVTGSNPLFRLQNWASQRNIPMEFVTFATFSDMYAALDAGSVDAVTDSQLTPMPNRKILVSIESLGVYFIGNKNDPGLMQELDDAITQIQYLKPGYQELLAAKYLYSQSYSSFTLNQKEQSYLNQLLSTKKPLRVAFPTNWRPIAYTDPKTGEAQGIMADVFTRISQLTGLHFEYIPQEEASQADIRATISSDFTWADEHNTYLSQSVFEVPIFMVESPQPEHPDILALVSDSHLSRAVPEHLLQESSSSQYLYFNSVTECMEAVSSGKAGRTYITSYELNYYVNQHRFAHLKAQPVPGFTESISIGVAKTNNPLLCSIICQALRSIPPTEINRIILNNTTFTPSHQPSDIIYAYPVETVIVVALLAALLGGMIFFYYSNKKNKRLRQQLEDTLSSRTTLLQKNKQLNELSQIDTLTDLPNRRGLDKFLARVYSDSSQLTLAMLDIDEFKKYNDQYGHLAGDTALKTVAHILAQQAQATGNFAARFGGEEFIWVDTHHTSYTAGYLLEKLHTMIFDKHILHEHTGENRLTISIGYAEKQPGESIDDLIRRADEALYEAKNSGRNQIRFASYDL